MKQRQTTVISLIAFAIIAFAYLAVKAQDLFYVVQAQDLFVYDHTHFDLISEQPGWLASYAGSFLTQFAYYPLLGIALFVVLLTLLAWLVKWAFRIPAQLSPLALVPSVLVVMFVMGWDYGIFASRHYGNLFSPIVGLICSMLLIGLLNLLKNIWVRYACTLVAYVLLYPVLGVYALLAAVISAGYPMVTEVGLTRRLYAAGMLVLFVIVTNIEVRRLFPSFNDHFSWIAGLPYMDFYKTQEIWIPVYIAGAFLFLLPVIVELFKKASPRAATIVSGIVALAAVILVPIRSFNDSNFRTLVAVEHAYGVGEDDKVLELCVNQEKPIRSIILYRNIELWKRGQLLDKMFQYTWSSDTIHSQNERMNTFISGARVYQQYTFWNFSYRWAVERMVKNKPSYVDLQLMAKDIVYNHEPELADKYLSKLESTLFYKDWASSQRRLLDVSVLHKDSLWLLHNQICVVPQGAIDNTEYCEYMLMKHFTNLYVNTETRAEQSLAAAMVMGNEEVFWQLCLATYKAHSDRALPRHVQEAALLFAFTRQNQSLFEQIQLMVGKDGAVCQQFLRNQDLFARLLSQPTQSDMTTLATLCPGTYWNYYLNESHNMIVYD